MRMEYPGQVAALFRILSANLLISVNIRSRVASGHPVGLRGSETSVSAGPGNLGGMPDHYSVRARCRIDGTIHANLPSDHLLLQAANGS